MDALRNIWKCMVHRTIRPSNGSQHRFPVCPAWADPKSGYTQFLQDMGPRPTDSHCIVRKNPTDGWHPANCVWGLPTEIKRINEKSIEFGGLVLSIGQWSRRLGMPEATLRTRLKTLSPEKAFLTPIRGDRSMAVWCVRFEGIHQTQKVCVDSVGETAAVAYARWNRIKNKTAGKYTLLIKNGTVENVVIVYDSTDRNNAEQYTDRRNADGL